MDRSITIRNANYFGKIIDVAINDGHINQVSAASKSHISADQVDAHGLTILPGFVDMHCHLREPGQENKETITTATKAAVAGGFTTICSMPNTMPVVDNVPLVRYIAMRAKEENRAKVLPIGAISKGLQGVELAEMALMKQAGAVAFSDDGCPVSHANLMRLALEYAKGISACILSHCEDKQLTNGGVVNEGYHASLAGLRGTTRAAEEVMIARDLILAQTLQTRVHICHVSTKGGVQLIREAKAKGVAVTAETCPHYIAATDAYILNYNTDAKVNPPLREQSDVDAVIQGLIDGTIDAIATDHAPHHLDDKNVEFDHAANGISGLETAFSLCYTHLVAANKIDLASLSRLLSLSPSKILGLTPVTIQAGQVADLVLVDEKACGTIDRNQFFSKGKNTPFHGQKVQGKVVLTMVDGQIKFNNGKMIV